MARFDGGDAFAGAGGATQTREGRREEVAGDSPLAEVADVSSRHIRGPAAVADSPVDRTDRRHGLHGTTRQTHHRTLVDDGLQVDGGFDFPRRRTHGEGAAGGGRLHEDAVLADLVERAVGGGVDGLENGGGLCGVETDVVHLVLRERSSVCLEAVL